MPSTKRAQAAIEAEVAEQNRAELARQQPEVLDDLAEVVDDAVELTRLLARHRRHLAAQRRDEDGR